MKTPILGIVTQCFQGDSMARPQTTQQGRYNMRKRVLESGIHDSATQTGNENKMDNHLNEIKRNTPPTD